MYTTISDSNLENARVNVQFGQVYTFKETGADILHFNLQFCLVISRRVDASRLNL